ncbi:MAG TPA: dCTP deaminase [Acidobacteriota bacterium]|nr:dCTP deaminase [Acidobacteriota bacterium]
MAVLPDHWIKKASEEHDMIVPFAAGRVRKGRISFGASCYGYDFRLSDEYRIPDFGGCKGFDPKRMSTVEFRSYRGRYCVIPPNSFVLGRSLEYFRIPRDVLVICLGKSTYARCGVIVNVTPLEPEWEGFITISLANASPVPVKVYSGEGIAQAVFVRAEESCTTSYADRKGKYQAQKEIQTSKV